MRRLFLLIILISFFNFANAESASKILPNNPFYFFKKVIYNVKLKLTKDEDKKFDIIFKNYKQLYFDFNFILENINATSTDDIKKPLSELKKSFLEFKNHILFETKDYEKIKQAADFSFSVLNKDFNIKDESIDDFKTLNKEFFLNILDRLKFEDSFNFLISLLKKDKIKAEDIVLIFQIKEILKNKKGNIWENEYLAYFEPNKFKNLIFQGSKDLYKFDLAFDYWKKVLIEKSERLQDIQNEINFFEDFKDVSKQRAIENLKWFLEKLDDKSKKRFQNVLKSLESNEAEFWSQFWETFLSIFQELLAPKVACVLVWDPVCGVDGKTYSNICFLKIAKVELAYKGACVDLDDIEKIEDLKDFDDSELDKILEDFIDEK
jgi:hypothetical protein